MGEGGERRKGQGEGEEGQREREGKEKLRRNAALVKESLMCLLRYILPQFHLLLAVIFRVAHYLNTQITSNEPLQVVSDQNNNRGKNK